jgi:hypothetical protein
VDLEMASQFQYRWAVDDSRRGPPGRLAGMDETLQGLLMLSPRFIRLGTLKDQ